MSIRSILSNAIEAGDSSSLGELLAANGFAEVEAGEMGEALLHYAEAAPLAEAEALSPAVTSYHSQTHGIEIEGDVTAVDLSFALPVAAIASESELVDFEQEVPVVDDDLDDFDLGDVDLDGIDDAGIDDRTSDLDDVEESGFDIDDLDGPLAAGIGDIESAVVEAGSVAATDFGVGLPVETASLDAEFETHEWSQSAEGAESTDLDEDLDDTITELPTDEPSIGFASLQDPTDLDFDDDILDFD